MVKCANEMENSETFDQLLPSRAGLSELMLFGLAYMDKYLVYGIAKM